MDQGFIPREFYTPGELLADHLFGFTPPFYVLLGVLFALLLVGSIVVYFLAPRLVRGHRLRAKVLRQFVAWLGGVSALGVFWVVCRSVGLPLFARPLWLWFTLIALGAVIGYYAYFFRKTYPRQISAYEEEQRRRRYLPQPRKRAAVRRR